MHIADSLFWQRQGPPGFVCRPVRHRAPEGGLARGISFLVDPDAAQRRLAESFVRKVFWTRHRALVGDVAPGLLLCSRGPRLLAVAGWRGARRGPLFLEQYLDEPIEVALSTIAGVPVWRWEVAEIGNLAAVRSSAALGLLCELMEILAQRDFRWLSFTATAPVRRILAKAGIPFWEIADADSARLGTAAGSWGDYYRCNPVVAACRLGDALRRAREFA